MNASLLQRLIEAGTPAELIAEVAELVGEMRSLEKRRASDARRKQEQRAREKEGECHVTSRDVRDIRDKVPLEVPPPAPPLPKTLQDISPYNPPNQGENDNLEQPVQPDQPETVELRPEHVRDEWNKVADRCGLTKVRSIEGTRLRKLRARIREHPPNDWIEVFDTIERTPWMHGDNDRGWRINFDFLLEPAKFNRLLEGTYERSNAVQ